MAAERVRIREAGRWQRRGGVGFRRIVSESGGGECGGGVRGVWATGFAPTSWRCGVGEEGGGASSKLEKVGRSSLPTHDITRRVPESGGAEQSTRRRREVCAVVQVEG